MSRLSLIAVPVFLSLSGFVLLMVGTATRVWMSTTGTTTQTVANTNSTLNHLGLFEACYLTVGTDNQMCASVTYDCEAAACWSTYYGYVSCLTTNIWALDNCSAYQSTRAFAVLACLFACMATVAMMGAAHSKTTGISRAGGLLSLVAGIFGMISMSVFVGATYNDEVKGVNVDDSFDLDWSFKVFTAGWVISFVAGLVGVFVLSKMKDSRSESTSAPGTFTSKPPDC